MRVRSSFRATDLEPNPPHEITATDLFAITLLSIDPPKPLVVRNITTRGREPHDTLATMLTRLDVDAALATADTATLDLMAAFYLKVKATLGGNPWVTASKLCARKRPNLFSVRDNLVLTLLGLLPGPATSGYAVNWAVYRRLILDPEITQGITSAVHTATTYARNISIETYPLRQLDVVLWMHARETRGAATVNP